MGCRCGGGAQLAVDATLVSPVRRNGHPQRRAHMDDGAQLRVARGRKEAKYPELLRSRRCRLVVLALEAGGRWSAEASTFVQLLSKSKARAFPPLLRRSVQAAYAQRWSGLLAAAAHRAFARTLLGLPVDEDGVEGEEVWPEEVMREARLLEPPVPSRLPAGAWG